MIYFDIDGVLAIQKWDENNLAKPLYPDGLRVCKPIRDAAKILVERGYDVGVLSHCSNFYEKEYKIDWLKENFPFIKKEFINFPDVCFPKNTFISPKENDILVDDMLKNLVLWQGKRVGCVNAVNSFTSTFKDINCPLIRISFHANRIADIIEDVLLDRYNPKKDEK
jgi:5'(3')-deoxyribonucleotidase